MRRGVLTAPLALALGAFWTLPGTAAPETPATAEPEPPAAAEPAAPNDLQSPEQLSTRYSAYSVPRGMWALDMGAFGISGGDAFAKLGATYGLGAGLEVEVNLAHVGIGLLNFSANWHLIYTRHFDLGVRAGVWYGHGDWFWIVQGAAKSLVSKVDVVSVPITLTASAPLTRWLQLDLGVQYAYGDIFGATSGDSSILEDAQIGLRQLFFRPGARFFISDNTALELFAKLPAFTDVPTNRIETTIPFSKTWTVEGGLRSRLADGLFGSLRLHYGDIADVLYGARLYPSFDLELHL